MPPTQLQPPTSTWAALSKPPSMARQSATAEQLLSSSTTPANPRSYSQSPLCPNSPLFGDSYVLIPVRLRRGCRCLLPLLSLSLLALAAFLIWPSNPKIVVARLHLDHVSVAARPAVAITISAALKLRVRNPDLFAFDYRSLDVAIGYRGALLGSVSSAGGRIRALAVSYIDTELHLDGIRVAADAIYLLEDLAHGSIPFDTVAEVEGRLRLFLFSVPVKGRISCLVHVNPRNQTILGQDCYPVG